MKKVRIAYWIVTGLFAAFMLFSAIPDILSTEEAKKIFDQIGMNQAMLPFLGIAKVLGAIAILIPSFDRLKEWAYAGLFFDLIGATYLMIAAGIPATDWGFMVLPIGLGIASYVLYHRLQWLMTPAEID